MSCLFKPHAQLQQECAPFCAAVHQRLEVVVSAVDACLLLMQCFAEHLLAVQLPWTMSAQGNSISHNVFACLADSTQLTSHCACLLSQ